MWLERASQKAIDEFWQCAGELEPFPRTLERALAFALPLTLVKLPRLRLWDIERYLQQRGILFQFDILTRSVRGCLIAYGGAGIIFLDGTDSTNEQRVTIAHEIAHFMVDYRMPRTNAIQKIGAGVVEVLDGKRAPSLQERVHGILNDAPIGTFYNLIERDPRGNAVEAGVWKIERRADRIALALLAPPSEILTHVNLNAPHFEMRQVQTVQVLQEIFGLPENFARAYASNLLDAMGKGPSWVEHFRNP